MSCSPCLTCSPTNFYSCTACDTSINSNLYLKGSLCVTDPTWYIQLACSCMLAVFILLPLLRKRSMVLLRILDIVQMAAYFKYINAYIYYRTDYLYLGMRGMNPWNEGLSVLSVSNDRTVPIFTSDETFVNQLIRISGTWVAVITLIALIGVGKTCCGDSKLQFSKFMSKNIVNAVSLAYYITIQDTAFFCANIFIAHQFSSVLDIIFFVIAIILVLLALILLVWQFSVINHQSSDKEDKLLHYESMVLYRMDYDLFETYSLPNLPTREKRTIRYSNLIPICILLKIGYATLVAQRLYEPTGTANDGIYTLLGYILFSQMVWYVALPFDQKSQVAQLIINILADVLLLAILIIPTLFNSSNFEGINLILCLSLFALALISAIIEFFLDLYSFLPNDLYDLGLTIIVEDKKLQKELQKRKQEQEQNERRIKELKDEHEKLIDEMKRKNNESKLQTKKSKPSRDNQSQLSLDRNEKVGDNESIPDNMNPDQFIYPIEEPTNSDKDDLSKYRIDVKKKRRVYEFDKKKPFVYSNKLDT